MPLNKIKSLLKHSPLLILLLLSTFIYSQERIVPLEYNPVLKEYSVRQKHQHFKLLKDSILPRPFRLDSNEFFDDFSENTYGTNKKFWLDDDAFINNDLCFSPPSFGVATFDGLNQYGNPYSMTDPDSKGQIADKLTSVPIDLSIFKYKDSLYLSFFYQPQGLADNPEEWDSFSLEFKPDRYLAGTSWDSNAWVRIWSIKGSTLKPFKQVMIPIKPYVIDTSQVLDTIARFYHKNFQFRFVNYGNLSGNLDHWHLDYVYLAKGRRKIDTAYNDIAIINTPVGVLKTYRSIPWFHLKKDSAYFADSLEISGRYLGNNFLNFKMGYLIQDVKTGDTLHYDCNTDSKDLFPHKIISRNVFSNFNLKKNFPYSRYASLGSEDTLRLKTTLISCNSDIHMPNNYSTLTQEFANYYAYDDGTAEAGYGIDLGGYNKAKVAYRFKISKQDTLRGIAIYFNQSKTDVSNKPFNLMVWKNKYDSTPDYQVETTVPHLVDTLVNDFYIYEFDTTGFVVNNTIYIGWEQKDEFIMNVGLDKNYYPLLGDSFPHTANPNIFYFFQNKWHSSSVSGTLMMRPIFGNKIPVSVKPVQKPDAENIRVFPNPANSILFIKEMRGFKNSLILTDMQGKTWVSQSGDASAEVDVNALSSGFYLLRIFDKEGKNILNKKVIINH